MNGNDRELQGTNRETKEIISKTKGTKKGNLGNNRETIGNH
jgi:hypothetical protein